MREHGMGISHTTPRFLNSRRVRKFFKKYGAKALAVLGCLGTISGFFKEDIKKYGNDFLNKPVLAFSVSQLSTASSYSNTHQYTGTIRIKNDGFSIGHDISFAVIAPLHCVLGSPQVETEPREAAPRMNPDSKSFQPKIDINDSPDTKIWHVDVWPKDAELVVKYPLSCSESLELSKPTKLGVGSFDEHVRSHEISQTNPISFPSPQIRNTSQSDVTLVLDPPVSSASSSPVLNARIDPDGNISICDKTPPEVTASTIPSANTPGWNNSDVTVSFAALDGPSGVDIVSGPVTIGVSDNKRFANHIQFNANYTWSHAIDFGQNQSTFSDTNDLLLPASVPNAGALRLQITGDSTPKMAIGGGGVQLSQRDQINAMTIAVRWVNNGSTHLSVVTAIRPKCDSLPIQDADCDATRPQLGVKVLHSGGAHLAFVADVEAGEYHKRR
jgi:hypothetical protein